ncbi:hypothetical protein [Desulfovibrio sp. DV]|uniref:hypothetical protein n=1 Tax=Desulfovibrio sp. DV TaxID=1844708 RepID=UPI0011153BAC|nr:hypothetical protein [Desulfovibrio sp. DV]
MSGLSALARSPAGTGNATKKYGRPKKIPRLYNSNGLQFRVGLPLAGLCEKRRKRKGNSNIYTILPGMGSRQQPLRATFFQAMPGRDAARQPDA